MSAPSPETTLEDAVGIAYRDLLNAGHDHEAASSLTFAAMCNALGVVAAHRAGGNRIAIEKRLHRLSALVDAAAYRTAGLAPAERMTITGRGAS